MRKFKQVISLIITFTFLVSNLTFAVPTDETAKAKPATKEEIITDPAKIVIPRDAGLVKMQYAGKSGKLIIHIQDAHCNYEAQSNIVKILETLVKNYNVNFISVEGADGVVDTSWFKAFPDDDVRKEVATYFMKKGEITGPEFLSITTDYPIKLFGAETRAYYIQNLNAFTSSYPLKEETEKYYNSIKQALNRLKGYIYSAELKDLDTRMIDYETKKVTFNDYVRFLQALAEKHKINLREYANFFKLVNTLLYEKKINFDVVDKERSVLIDELSRSIPKESLTALVEKSLMFKAGKISSAEYYDYLKALAIKNEVDLSGRFPNLSNYIIYNSVYSKIENEKLFQDIKNIEVAIKENLFLNEDQRTLEKLSRHVDTLIGLVNIKLLNADFEYYKTHKEEFAHEAFTDFIKDKTIQFGLAYDIEPPSDAVAQSIPKLEDFYAVAIKRDNALVDNTISAMSTDKQDIAVLITGGFHSDGITKILERQNISYAVVCPSITKDVPTPYIQILTNQRTSFEDILMSAADTKQGMLAPVLISYAIGLSDEALNKLDNEILGDGGVKQRMVRVEDQWTRLDVALWLRKSLEYAGSHNLPREKQVMKEAFKLALDQALSKLKGGRIGSEEKELIIRGIMSSDGFIREFDRVYDNYLRLTPPLPAQFDPDKFEWAPGKEGTIIRDKSLPTVMFARHKDTGEWGAFSGGLPAASVPQPDYNISRGDAYSGQRQFDSYAMARLQEILDKHPELEADANKYNKLDPIVDKAERDKTAAKIEGVLSVYNIGLIEKMLGVSEKALTENNLKNDIPTLEDFEKNPSYEKYLAMARNIYFNGGQVKMNTRAGAASRLFGEGQDVDPTLSYAAHDVFQLNVDQGRCDERKLRERGARFGFSMLTREKVQEWIDFEDQLIKAGLAKNKQEAVDLRKMMLKKQPQIEVVNEESGPQIVKEFVDNGHYGFDPELVVFVLQPAHHGLGIKDKKVYYEKDSRPLPAGHGEASLDAVQTGRAFIIDKKGNIIPLEDDAVTYLKKKTDNAIQVITESRTNDMLKLGMSGIDEGKVIEHRGKMTEADLDLKLLAQSLYQMENTTRLDVGSNLVLEQLGLIKKSGKTVKGGSPLVVNGKDVIVEAIAQTADLKKMLGDKGQVLNRFFINAKVGVFSELAKKEGLPIYIRFRDGYFYPETVTSDITMLEGANAGYVIEKSRYLNDYKDDKTFDNGIDAAIEQDHNNTLFVQYSDELNRVKADIAVSGFDKIQVLKDKYRPASYYLEDAKAEYAQVVGEANTDAGYQLSLKRLGSEDKINKIVTDPALFVEERALAAKYIVYGKGSIFRFWDELSNGEKRILIGQLKKIDLDEMERIIQKHVLNKEAEIIPSVTSSNLSAPPIYDLTKEDSVATQLGEEAFRNGQVAILDRAVSVFTTGGIYYPKIIFNASQVMNKSIARMRAEKIMALSRKYNNRMIPWIIVTNDANHDEIVKFFTERQVTREVTESRGRDKAGKEVVTKGEVETYFGQIPITWVRFIRQKSVPIVTNEGELVLQDKNRVATGGFGYGDVRDYVLRQSALLNWLVNGTNIGGIKYIALVGADNAFLPTAQAIGYHILGTEQDKGPAQVGREYVSFIGMDRKAGEVGSTLLNINEKTGIVEDIRLPRELGYLRYAYVIGAEKVVIYRNEKNEIVMSNLDELKRKLDQLSIVRPPDIEKWADTYCLTIQQVPETETVRYAGKDYTGRTLKSYAMPLMGTLSTGTVIYNLSSFLGKNPLVSTLPFQTRQRVVTGYDPVTGAKRTFQANNFGSVAEKGFLVNLTKGAVIRADRTGEQFTRESTFAQIRQLSDVKNVAATMSRYDASILEKALGWHIYPSAMVELSPSIELLEPQELTARIGQSGTLGANSQLYLSGVNTTMGQGLTVAENKQLLVRIEEESGKAAVTIGKNVTVKDNAAFTIQGSGKLIIEDNAILNKAEDIVIEGDQVCTIAANGERKGGRLAEADESVRYGTHRSAAQTLPGYGGATTVTGDALTTEQHAKVNSIVRLAFEKKEVRPIKPEGAESGDIKVFEVPGLAEVDDILIGHPGRGGEAADHSLKQIYMSPERVKWVGTLPPDVRAQYWAHEIGQVRMLSVNPEVTEEEVQVRYPITKVLEYVAAKTIMPDRTKEPEAYEKAITQRYVNTDKRELLNTLSILRQNAGLLAHKKIVIAYDTGLAPRETIQAGESSINEYLGGKLIEVRGTGADLLARLRIEAAKLNEKREDYVVVTVASVGTVNEIAGQDIDALDEAGMAKIKALKELGRVIRISDPDSNRYMPVIGLYDLALQIAFILDEKTGAGRERILNCLNRLAVNPNNPEGFTKDDLDQLLRRGLISILPKITPANTDEQVAAYNAAKEALRAL